MPKLSQERSRKAKLLQPCLRVVNGEYAWGELKSYYLARYATGMQLRRPEVTYADLKYPADDEYKYAVKVLSDVLQRWAAHWLAHPPSRKHWDMSLYIEENAEIFREFREMAGELPKEAVLTLFVPGQATQALPPRPSGPGKWIKRRVKKLLPTGALSGKFYLEDYVNDVLAAVQFDSPLALSKAMAVGLFRTLLQSGIRLGRCHIPECNRYFLDLSGVSKFCSRRHAQAAVNRKRRQTRESAIPKIIEAIKEFERLGAPGVDWKSFVAKRARVKRYWVTRLINNKIISGPQDVGKATRKQLNPKRF